jgi:hypothetical protein
LGPSLVHAQHEVMCVSVRESSDTSNGSPDSAAYCRFHPFER